MENFIIYLGKASVLVIIFFLSYFILLRKETFFNANRGFLLLGIVTSLVLPFLVFTKIILVEPIAPDFSTSIENVSVSEFIPAKNAEFSINWFYVTGSIYFAGVFIFFGRFTKDILQLLKIIRHKKPKNQEGFKLIDSDKIQSPFSFFKYIIYNSNSFKNEELQNIITHEKIHSSQYHSADMLFSQLFCIVFWFNPVSWLYKKAIAQNLEFIADSLALTQVSDKIVYQKTLLKVSAPQHCISITNHFYQSLIKKRIIMLNKTQSKKRNSWKYATVLPLLTLFMLQFQVETVAQEKENAVYAVSTTYNDDNSSKGTSAMMVLSSTSEKDLKEYISRFVESKKMILSFSDLKRNDKNEIIQITFKYDDFNGNSGTQKFSNSGKPIDAILFEIKNDLEGKPTLKITDLANGNIAKNHSKVSNDSINISKKDILKTQEPVLIVVDGKIKGMSDKVSLPEENTIVSIDVLKNDSSIEKYGNDGKNGVILITTNSSANSQSGASSISFKTHDSSENLENIKNNPTVDYKKALIIIDGKQSNSKELMSMDPDKMVSIGITPSNTFMIQKYGKRWCYQCSN